MSGLRTRLAGALDAIWYGDSVLRWALWPLSLLFRAAVACRAALYSSGAKRAIELPVPVIVVGNVTAGGTGKTPLVIWLAERLREAGHSPGIVTRGYGGRARAWPQPVSAATPAELVGDEPVLLAARAGCPVVAGPDRVAAARTLLARADCDVLLSDDGLQHYRMARAFEIAVVDGARGLGNRLPLPAGPLREPPSRLETVDAVVVHEPPPAEWAATERAALEAANDARGPGGTPVGPSGDADRGPTGSTEAPGSVGAPGSTGPPGSAGAAQAAALRGPLSARMTLAVSRVYRILDGRTADLGRFAGRPVHAVAGIGDPERFFRLLERAGLEVVRHPLADHARIRRTDLEPRPPAPVLVTEKDAVKCRDIAHEDVWCVAVEAVVEPAGAARLLGAIERRLGATRAAPPR